MDWKYLFLSFQGRIHRLNWWVGTLLVVALNYAISMFVLWWLGGDPAYYWNDSLPTREVALADALAFLATLHISLAIDVKRIHDRGLSAYLLMPVYLFSLLFILSESYGWDQLLRWLLKTEVEGGLPFEAYVLGAFFIMLLVYTLWMLVELGFRRGTGGTSKYGPDPLASLTERTDEAI